MAVRFRARNREDGNEGPREEDSDPREEDSNARVAWALVSDIRDGAYFPGALHVGSRPSSAYADVRGGIFADDPGLGKSVTALALVTRSRAALPSPPPGAGEITRGTPPSYVVPAPAGGKALERWWTRAPTAATDEAEALEIEAETARRRKKKKREEEEHEPNARAGEGGNDTPTTIPSIPSTPSIPFVPTDGSNLREDADAEPSSPSTREPASSLWVTCDECGKWRRLPPGATPPAEGATWYCQLQEHLPPRQRSCAIPEEKQTKEEWTKEAMGCYQPGAETPCQERNVRLFLDAIRESRERDSRDRVDDTARHARLLVAWLRRGGRGANLEPGGEGLYAPSDMAQPTRRILAKVLHLLPSPHRPGMRTRTSAGCPADSRPADRENARERHHRTRTRRSGAVRGVSRRRFCIRSGSMWTLWRRRRRDARKRRSESIAFGTSSGNAISPRTTRDSDEGVDDEDAKATRRAAEDATPATTRRRARRSPPQPRLWVRLERAARWRAGLVLPGSKTAFACFSPPPRSSSFPTRRSSNTGSVRLRGTFARPEARGRSRARRRRHVREGGVRVGGGPRSKRGVRVEAMGDDVVVPGADPPGTHRARDFPPAETLAREYDVVLSTFDRMSQRSKGGNRDDLLRVHFLRLIVDEGHLLGSVGSETTRAQRVRAIRAERRWIMTGTPAPAVRASDGGGLGGARGKMSRAMATATHDVAARRTAPPPRYTLFWIFSVRRRSAVLARCGTTPCFARFANVDPRVSRRCDEPCPGFWFARVRRSWGYFRR